MRNFLSKKKGLLSFLQLTTSHFKISNMKTTLFMTLTGLSRD